MRFKDFEVLTETAIVQKKLGRDLNHLEDYVFFYGSNGTDTALDILHRLGHDSSDVSIKWDGQIAIYWGREADGSFIMVGKNGWGRSKSYTSKDLSKFIKNSGKGEDWREKLGNDMGEMFDILERATPGDFRGFVFADVLYHPGKLFETTKYGIMFTPNIVTYIINPDSKLGKRMSNSKLSAVVHSISPEFGSKENKPFTDINKLNSSEAVILGPTYVTHLPKIDVHELDAIRKEGKSHANNIDQFLKFIPGLADLKTIIYTYVNQMSKAKKLDQLEHGFFDWLAQSKISSNKQAKIQAMDENNPTALPAIFMLVKKIMDAKDHIIHQYDAAPSDVQSFTKEKKGGEGYVALNSKVKLVPRTRWNPSI